MMTCTQDQLNSIWAKRAERDEHGLIDVSEIVSGCVHAIMFETDTDQMLTIFPHVETFSDRDSNNTNFSYTRTRLSKIAAWEEWKRQ